jgi:hypothetical protein
MVAGIYVDPDFEIGSSSTIARYTEKLAPPFGVVTFVHVAVSNSIEVTIFSIIIF